MLRFFQHWTKIFFNVVGGIGPYTYEWIGNNEFNSNNANISSLEAGIYSLTITDENECSIDTTIFITQPAGISLVSFDLSDYNFVFITFW